MKTLIAFIAASVAFCAAPLAQAAVVGFTGNFTTYTPIIGGADPLALGLPEFFQAEVTTSGSSIVGGRIIFPGANKASLLTGGTVTIGATTTDFTGIAVQGGGTLQFSFSTAIANTSDPSYLALNFRTAGAALSGGFAGGAAGFYNGNAIAAVPEPTVTFALAGLVLGCGGWQVRKRRKAA